MLAGWLAGLGASASITSRRLARGVRWQAQYLAPCTIKDNCVCTFFFSSSSSPSVCSRRASELRVLGAFTRTPPLRAQLLFMHITPNSRNLLCLGENLRARELTSSRG